MEGTWRSAPSCTGGSILLSAEQVEALEAEAEVEASVEDEAEAEAAAAALPFHHAMLSDFFKRLSPIQPEMGMTGVFFSTKSFFQPTLMSVLFISLPISS